MFNFLNNTELLSTFIAVSESDTLLQASKKLKVSQATVSLRLRKFQEFFGFPIFEKRGRKIVILPSGFDLKEVMKGSALNFEATIAGFLFQKNLKGSNPIKIGARQEVFLKLGTKLKVDFPIELFAMNSSATKSALLSSEIDVALTHLRPVSHEFISKLLFTDSFVLCCSKKLSKKIDTLNPKQLAEFCCSHPALIYGRNSRLLNDFIRFYKLDSSRVRAAVTCEDWSVLKNFLINGTGYGIFPKTFIRDLDEGIFTYEIPAKVIQPLGFYYIYKQEFRNNVQIQELGNRLKAAF